MCENIIVNEKIEKHIIGKITPSRIFYEPLKDHIARRKIWLADQKVCQTLTDPKYIESQKKAYGLMETWRDMEWQPYSEKYPEPELKWEV